MMNEQRPANFLDQQRYEQALKKRTPKRTVFFVLAGVFLCLAILVLFFRSEDTPTDPNQYNPVTLEPKEPDGFFKKLSYFVFKKEPELEGTKDDRVNVLLLGMGGPGHDGPYLTDTIMIASIKPSENKVALISIPRDLAVDIPGYGVRKINHANAFGEMEKPGWGGAFATEVIGDLLDIDIHYYVRVDFAAFEELINEVGGVKVNVDRTFTDPLYPAPNNEYQTVTFTKGIQTMDGDKALMYARSRHGSNGEGSDFARARRQQKVLLALKEKVLSFQTLANPVRIHNIINSLESHITTNASFADIMTMLKLAKDMNTEEISTLVLDTSPNGLLENGQSPGGAFILLPKSGTFDEVRQAVAAVFEESTHLSQDTTPAQDTPKLPAANIEVQNGTWHAGMAARMRKRLQDDGFIVTDIGNTEERPVSSSGIYAISDNAPDEVLTALQKELQIAAKQTPPTAASAATGTDILLILGEDFGE